MKLNLQQGATDVAVRLPPQEEFKDRHLA